ncbi:MAG: tetraacyldisaccharide 4'-kinase, partial [Candidatus Omnitrophica bacterium]|nr:tetraacyldisaccharide 4'-kinase [Candidatus Omnitrophota bacterium]
NDLFSNIVKIFLYLLSLFYGLILRIIRNLKLKRAYRFNCKIIGVGNITLGGTGKTLLVEYISKFLKEKGRSTAIIRRGYAKGQNLKDEADMLKAILKDTPIIVNKDRIEAIKEVLTQYAPDTVILDDSFQQWQIEKDLEIVTVDATNPFGNGYLLPRGILREPLDGLKRADLVVLTKTNLNPDTLDLKVFIERINPKASVFEASYSVLGFYKLKENNLISPSYLSNKRVILFSGIADPFSFKNMILNLGIEVVKEISFPDHHLYKEKDIEEIKKASQEKTTNIFITTEKDAVKLKDFEFEDLEVFILKVEIKIRDEELFHKRLLSIYNC